MVFAHPGHELSVLGLVQRLRPQILYMTQADGSGDAHRVELTNGVLDPLGLAGHAAYLGVRERQSYERALNHDVAFYQAIRNRIIDWLLSVKPTVVLVDAFEHYNFHHDLCAMLVNSAIDRYQQHRGVLLPCQELPLACYSSSDLVKVPLEEFDEKDAPLHYVKLTEEETNRKLALWTSAARQNRYVSELLEHAAPGRRSVEVFREVGVNRDFTRPPAWRKWPTYDEIGRSRVQRGRYVEPLLFAEHFLPITAAIAAVPLRKAG